MAPLRNKLRGNCISIDASRTNFVMTRNFWGGCARNSLFRLGKVDIGKKR